MFEILQYIFVVIVQTKGLKKKVTKINTSAMTEICDELGFGNS